METTLEGLQTQTVYVLRMCGYNQGGDGKLSEGVYFTVLGKSYFPYTGVIIRASFRVLVHLHILKLNFHILKCNCN